MWFVALMHVPCAFSPDSSLMHVCVCQGNDGGLGPEVNWDQELFGLQKYSGAPDKVNKLSLSYCVSILLSTQLTIIFKSFQECVDQKVYQAEMDELPAAFTDGSKNGGEKHGANSLKITEKVSGQHIEIQAKYIGTTIVVRQVGRYLTFAVRMPEEVVNAVEDRDNQGLYLCLRGCPLNQQIDFQAFHSTTQTTESRTRLKGPILPASPDSFTYEAAMAKCREKLPVEDLYFQSCVFDLLTTGDVNFTLAAYYAFEDVKILHSNKDKLHLYERTQGLEAGNMAASEPAVSLLLLLVALACLSQGSAIFL